MKDGSFLCQHGRGDTRLFYEEIGGEVLSCWKLWPRAGSRREPMLGP